MGLETDCTFCTHEQHRHVLRVEYVVECEDCDDTCAVVKDEDPLPTGFIVCGDKK